MKASQFTLATLRNTPSDADVISAQLMIKAGLIRKLVSGLYVWMPMGLRVLKRVEKIVREEMERIDAQELLMPVVQPAELWQESGRWEDYGAELLRFKDRHNRDFVLGPTHEEVITDITRNQLNSYKQLPCTYYQIQTKFRDEIRPRFGVMRAREFTMKDAYSFHIDKDSLAQTYQDFYDAYERIFTRLGLDFRAVQADTGSIGGFASHEFHVLADSGEDDIAFSTESDYSANVELAEAVCITTRPAPSKPRTNVDTPNMPTCQEVAEYLGLDLTCTVKTLIVKGSHSDDAPDMPKLVALVLRGDHTLNELKAQKLPQVKAPLEMATEDEIKTAGLIKGYIGVDLAQYGMTVIVDKSASVMADFVSGANIANKHTTGMNWERDAVYTEVADIRNVVNGDPSPDGKGVLQIKRGIEVGHIFQLGNKYSHALGCTVLGKEGKPVTLMMGCYGIGVSRIIAASLEQNHDDKGCLWADTPDPADNIAPFYVAVVPMKSKDGNAEAKADELYKILKSKGVNVLLDDRDERAGVKFADLELIGIPHRIVVSERNLTDGKYEYAKRGSDDKALLELDELLAKF